MTLAQERPYPSAPRARSAQRSRPTAAPPPRPRLTSDLPLPGTAPAPRTGTGVVRLTAAVWAAAGAAAVAGVASMAVDGDGLRERLTATAQAADPAASEELVESGVRTTLLAVLGAEAALGLLLLVWAALLLTRRSWARWALVVTGAVAAPAAALAQSIVAGGPDADRIAFLAQIGLVVVGLAVLVSRPVRRALGRR